jgi:hypothetical protein
MLCYGVNLKHQFRRYGYFIDKILKGTKPGDPPIEEPTTHELIVIRTAKLLGLSNPEFHFDQRRRGDRIKTLFAALHESGCGTFPTCRDSLTMSAHRGKADIPPQGRDFRF